MPRKTQYKLCSRESGEPTWLSRVQNDLEEHYKICVHGGNTATRRQTCARGLAYTASIRVLQGNGRTHDGIIIELCRQPLATCMKPKLWWKHLAYAFLKRMQTKRWLRNMLCHDLVTWHCHELRTPVDDWPFMIDIGKQQKCTRRAISAVSN